MLGFQTPGEIAGMVLGVALWVACFSGLCASTSFQDWLRQPRLDAALKRAVWIKIGLTAAGWFLLAGASALRMEGAQVLGMFGMIDTLLGMAALWVVGQVGAFRDLNQIAQMDSLGWTAITTIVEGALMAVVIGLIAFAVLGWWRLTAGSGEKQKLSSVQIPD